MKFVDEKELLESWALMLKSSIPFWENFYLISKYQKNILDNYLDAFFNVDMFKMFIRFAPTYLTQSINPWSFSLIQFTKELKGSPFLEYKILTEVAGYGSQLSKIIDFLEIFEKKYPLIMEEMEHTDIYRYHKFKELVEDLKSMKDKI